VEDEDGAENITYKTTYVKDHWHEQLLNTCETLIMMDDVDTQLPPAELSGILAESTSESRSHFKSSSALQYVLLGRVRH